jgi:hypothetical protein
VGLLIVLGLAACRPLGEQAVGVAPGITPEKTASQPLASDSSGKSLDQNIYQRFPDSFRIVRRGPC